MSVILALDQALMDYLEVDHTADNTLIGRLIEDAHSTFEEYTKTPITAASFTEYHDGGVSRLFLRRRPMSTVAGDLVVTDTQGTSEDATDDEILDAQYYRAEHHKAVLIRTTSNGGVQMWSRGIRRWKVVYKAGLDQHENWTAVQRELRRTFMQLIRMWYDGRDPSIKNERVGPITASYTEGAIPEKITDIWDKHRTDLM